MKTALYYVIGLILIVAAVGAAGLFWFGHGPEIAAIAPPDPTSFPADLVDLGGKLAAIGDCGACHTTPDGQPYAGGMSLATPFGTVFSTNITPDPETGIGKWSEAAFERAMTEGIDRTGNHLYPVFPYDHFTRVTSDDMKAIYAFLMSQPAVSAKAPPSVLSFPFNQRPLLAVWNLLYLDRTPWAPDPKLDATQNRGAYLVDGLGHCGSCHTPRTMLGGLDRAKRFQGAEAEGWYVPAIGAATHDPAGWTEKAYENYLFDGWDRAHGLGTGPMGVVVDHLADASEDDVSAMAAYLATLTPEPAKDVLAAQVAAAGKLDWAEDEKPGGAGAPNTDALRKGEQIFAATCIKCHKARVAETQPVSLALSAVVSAPDGRNFVHLVRHGITPPYASRQRTMPAQDRTLSDDDLQALAAFVRWRFTDLPDWTDLAQSIAADAALNPAK